MAHTIRDLTTRIDIGPLMGEVEVDESYVGGYRPGTTGRGAKGKTIVLGMKSRGGNMVAYGYSRRERCND